MNDPVRFALDLAAVVRHLQQIPTGTAPPARNRARPLAEFDVETRQAIESAAHLIDAGAALAVWDEAVSAAPHKTGPL